MFSNFVLGRCKASTYRRRVRLGFSRSGRLTNSAARTNLALKIRPAHHLAGVHRRDARYSSRRGPYSSRRAPCGLARGKARLGAAGLGG